MKLTVVTLLLLCLGCHHAEALEVEDMSKIENSLPNNQDLLQQIKVIQAKLSNENPLQESKSNSKRPLLQ